MTTVERIRRRGGIAEFAAPQRPGFELLIAVGSGSATHEVDFNRYTVNAHDVLWVHTGQVQLWGDIRQIEGTVVMFNQDALPPETAELLRSLRTSTRNHWDGAAHPEGPFSLLLAGLVKSTIPTAKGPVSRAREAATAHALSAALLLLSCDEPNDEDQRAEPPEGFTWLIEEIERNFTAHRTVAWYAQRLGYSERTLNRFAQAHAGISTKEMIDQRTILEAKRLLVHEQSSITEIAARLGFDDPANFSKYFRHRAGTSPGRFRANSSAGIKPAQKYVKPGAQNHRLSP
ncbi:helix-turn-helix domain-containing protein [Arthrobacter sp. NPDC090010]|uniref:helix-turn-helix domain-containing protein n=1 Tax=Arthrobacter sp. NPDC090010 TaxID=3363942 RepID=UPI00382BA3EB